jgi:hypothetical protein
VKHEVQHGPDEGECQDAEGSEPEEEVHCHNLRQGRVPWRTYGSAAMSSSGSRLLGHFPSGSASGQTLMQVIGGTLSFAAAHPVSGCGSHLDCDSSVTVTRRGSRGVCPARSSTAHLAVPAGIPSADEVSSLPQDEGARTQLPTGRSCLRSERTLRLA